MSSKSHWKRRAKALEADRDERSAQRSQALADLDVHAQEIDFLRTIVNEWVVAGAVALGFPEEGCWAGRNGTSGELTPTLVEAVRRAQAHVDEHAAALRSLDQLTAAAMHPDTPAERATEMLDLADRGRAILSQDTPGVGGAPLAIIGAGGGAGARLAARLGAVPLEELPPDAQARGELRLAAVRQVLGAGPSERDDTLLDEPDVNVSLADAAEVVAMVRDALINRGLSALSLLLTGVLPRIEYQAGCENDLYRRLHGVTLRHAIADAIAPEGSGSSIALEGADRVLATLKRQLPKLVGGAAAEL